MHELKITPDHLLRFADIIPEKITSIPITVIGAGAIGSWTILNLCKSGFNNITVYDHDEVNAVNVGTQLFGFSDVGKMKVFALRDKIKDLTGVEIKPKGIKFPLIDFTGKMNDSHILIMAVDSMDARKTIFDFTQKNPEKFLHVIDARMSAEIALIYRFMLGDYESIQDYKKTQYGDDTALQERCTAKATCYTGCLIGATLTLLVKQILLEQKAPNVITWSIADYSLKSFC